MKLTFEQKVRRDCLPKYLQQRFDHINSLIHFIDPDFELFCCEEAVKISRCCQEINYYDISNEESVWRIICEDLSNRHITSSLKRSISLSNDYLRSFQNAD